MKNTLPTLLLFIFLFSIVLLSANSIHSFKNITAGNTDTIPPKNNNHLCLIKGPERKPLMLTEAVADSLYLWNKNKILKVYFWKDDMDIGKDVLKIASEWTPYSGIKLIRVYDRTESDIRVSFQTKGFWSYIGSYAEKISKKEITLSLDSIFLPENIQRFRNVILHEFGHALGLIHEHQHPGFNIPWIKPKLFNYFKQTYNIDSTWVYEQVINKFNKTTGIYCTPDLNSIMIYSIPPGVTVNNKYVVDWPANLSELDKKFIKNIYNHKKCTD